MSWQKWLNGKKTKQLREKKTKNPKEKLVKLKKRVDSQNVWLTNDLYQEYSDVN